MKTFLANYKSSLILLGAIIIGGAVGVFMGPEAVIFKPVGDLFLNLLFMTLVPLVFFSVTSAISNMGEMKRLGKILGNIVLVFTVTAIISGIIGIIGVLIVNPTKGLDTSTFAGLMANAEAVDHEKVGILQQIVNTVTVTDFKDLLSKSNMLQLIIFSILVGVATAMAGEKAKPIAKFVEAGSAVMMKIVDLIMNLAPIGLGCYFASVIGELGPQILSGYARAFILYLILTAVLYFGLFTVYAYMSGGKDGIKIFWKHAIAPTVTALATCSSAASIPVNLDASKKMGVPEDIAETVIPLGANIHKDGSVIGGVLKVTFLFGLFGRDMTSISAIFGILAVSFLVGAVMGAIPGGGMMGEMLILSVYGFSPEVLPIIAVISTIIDAPATVLNSTGNTVCSMMVARLVEGKDWLKGHLAK
ncbi:dicarboxylate/amino acid:cation symporter [Romboutsia weinsteinii]|uniref:Dicarboxylate/amino acid:cation symporter n=1 Tax=Romboutsia weinsteinii TaxID=2020949 RepID=A0A371J704_9FIRM|nr:dicarboxylate/amino acid:cation symporter [Romboutsia weinsteinii]RDY28561.1 dicarboxylate/amino acid:cation symporter [Romboutsia weinsteinii]